MRTLSVIFTLLLLQPAGSGRLSGSDRDHLLKVDVFQILTSVKDLPQPVKLAFAKLTREKIIVMADPGEEFQKTDAIDKEGLPNRRLIFAGLSADHCFLHYESGGIGHAYYIVLFRFRKSEARFVWGGASWESFLTLDSLRKAIEDKKIEEDLPYYW